MSTTDLRGSTFPVGHLIEQGLALPQVWIIRCVPAIVCGAARSYNCATDEQYAANTV